MTYTYRADQMACPNCGGIAVSDSVDIGVGLQVRGNFACDACHWCADAELGLDDTGPGDGLFNDGGPRP